MPSAADGIKSKASALQSILVSDKRGEVKVGQGNLSFEISTQLCRDEAAAVRQWDPATCQARHHNVIAALKVVYPNKRGSWFGRPFVVNPAPAAEYWAKVLDAS